MNFSNKEVGELWAAVGYPAPIDVPEWDVEGITEGSTNLCND